MQRFLTSGSDCVFRDWIFVLLSPSCKAVHVQHDWWNKFTQWFSLFGGSNSSEVMWLSAAFSGADFNCLVQQSSSNRTVEMSCVDPEDLVMCRNNETLMCDSFWGSRLKMCFKSGALLSHIVLQRNRSWQKTGSVIRTPWTLLFNVSF